MSLFQNGMGHFKLREDGCQLFFPFSLSLLKRNAFVIKASLANVLSSHTYREIKAAQKVIWGYVPLWSPSRSSHANRIFMCVSRRQYSLYAIHPTCPTQNMVNVGKAKMVSLDRFSKILHLCAFLHSSITFSSWGRAGGGWRISLLLLFPQPDCFSNRLNITPFIVMLKRSI